MGKTYSVRKVEGGGVSSRPLKEKKRVLVSFPHSATPLPTRESLRRIQSWQSYTPMRCFIHFVAPDRLNTGCADSYSIGSGHKFFNISSTSSLNMGTITRYGTRVQNLTCRDRHLDMRSWFLKHLLRTAALRYLKTPSTPFVTQSQSPMRKQCGGLIHLLRKWRDRHIYQSVALLSPI